MNASEYNRQALVRGELTDEHLVTLVRHFQRTHGSLVVDGKAGPNTRAALERSVIAPDALRVVDGWLHGDGVHRMPADPSWFGEDMPKGPLAIMAHYTATPPGTALTMAARRTVPRKGGDRVASWHVTIATDGATIQMIPFGWQAWHCATGLVPVRGGGMRPNQCAIGIELEGHGKEFPDAQVAAARRVWYAIVHAYGIPQELAMLQHSEFDKERRRDPGEVWMTEHAGSVIAHAYLGV